MRAMVRSQQRGGFKGEEYIRNRSSLCEDYTHRATQDPCHAVGFERGLVNKEKVLMPKRYNNDPIVFIDLAPPLQAAKVVYGWIRKGQGMVVISLS